jgi:steroid delta-isomerase-like uncharacterized protein
MSTEANKNVIRQWWESLNQRTALETIAATSSTNYVLHDPSLAEPVQGTQGVRDFVTSVLAGFPDARYTIEHLVAEGDIVTQHISVQGTHQGEFNGIPATGKTIAVQVMVVSRIASNKVVEEWQLFDALGMLTQMGVIPPPEQDGG